MHRIEKTILRTYASRLVSRLRRKLPENLRAWQAALSRWFAGVFARSRNKQAPLKNWDAVESLSGARIKSGGVAPLPVRARQGRFPIECGMCQNRLFRRHNLVLSPVRLRTRAFAKNRSRWSLFSFLTKFFSRKGRKGRKETIDSPPFLLKEIAHPLDESVLTIIIPRFILFSQ